MIERTKEDTEKFHAEMAAIGRSLEQKPIERIAYLERHRPAYSGFIHDSRDAVDRELANLDRLTLVEVEGDEHVTRRAHHGGIDHHAHEAALPVEQNEPDHVAPELQLVEHPFLAEADPSHPPGGGEETRFRCRDDRAERVVVDRLVADERQSAHHTRRRLLLSGEGAKRGQTEAGDGEERGDAQLTVYDEARMLAGHHPDCQPFRHRV